MDKIKLGTDLFSHGQLITLRGRMFVAIVQKFSFSRIQSRRSITNIAPHAIFLSIIKYYNVDRKNLNDYETMSGLPLIFFLWD